MSRMFEGLFTEEGMKTEAPSLDLGDIESTVKGYTDKYGIDYDLVSALIKQESGGDPSATSGAGAIGLMQIIPSTAQGIAQELGETYTPEKHKDPETNIRWGTYHLKTLLDRFGGDELKALAAYHAGEGAVSKAEQQGKRVPDTYDRTAGISTKDYVRQVMGKKGTDVSYGEMTGGRMFAGLFEGVEFPERKKDSEVPRETQPPTEMVRTEEGLRKGTTLEEVVAKELPKPSLEEKIVGGAIDKIISLSADKPTTQTKLDKRGLLESIAESFKRGNVKSALDYMSYEAMTGKRDWKEVNRLLKGYEQKLRDDPIEANNWLSKAVMSVSGMLPNMIKGLMRGQEKGLAGAIGAGGAALVGGQIGPQVAIPEEIVTVPLAAGAGYAVGQAFGSTDYWRRVGAGSMFADLKSKGIQDKTASTLANIASVPYALIEQAQIKKFIPGSDKVLKEIVTKNILNKITTLATRRGIDIAEQTVQEGLQGAIDQTTQEMGQYVEGQLRKKDLGESAKKVLNRFWTDFKESIIPMTLLMSPKIAKGGVEIGIGEKKEGTIPEGFVKTKEGATVSKEFAEKGLPAAPKVPTTVDDMVENLLSEGGIYTKEMIAKGKAPKSEMVKSTKKDVGFKPKGKATVKTTAYEPITGKDYPVETIKAAKDIALEKIGGELTKVNELQYDKFLTAELAKYKEQKPKEIKVEKLTPEKELRKRVRETKPPPKEKEFEHFRKVIEESESPTAQPENMAEELGIKKPFEKPDKIKGQGGFITIPDAKDIKAAAAKIASVVSTETPYKLAEAPETGRAVKLLNSRLSVADEKALDFVKKGAADIQPNKITLTVQRHVGGAKLKGAKKTIKVGVREEVDVELSEDALVFFATANPKHLDKITPTQRTRLKKVVDTFSKMNKKYETELKEMGVLERGWPESAIKRNEKQIEYLKKEMTSKHKRPVKKIVDEINQLTEDNKALGEMKYMHFPARVWLADKYDNDPEAFKAILSGSFKGIKGRKTIDPFDLVEAGVLDPSKVSAKEAMAVYMRYVDSQKAQVAIRDMAIMEKAAIKTGNAPSDYIDMGSKYPLFEGYKLHPMVAENIANTFDLIGTRQGTVEKIMSVTKMLQFYNPVIMPMYDTFQAAAVTQGRFLRPKHFKKAVIDVIKKTPAYYEAADNGLYSKPFKNTFSNFKKDLERIKESQTIKDAVKFEFQRLKENPARVLADMYTASWNTAWFGDKILRMASYNTLRNQGLSPKDAAKFAAEAHADYAGVPAKTRKALNKVFFTPTFQISMLKWHTKMFLSALRTPISTVGRITGHPIGKTAGKDWIRAASFASAVGMLMAMDYGLRNGLGWEREEFGRKYKKNIKYKDKNGNKKEEQVVVTLSNPINVPLKYYYTFVKPKPGMTKSEQIAKYGKYWLHPLLKLGLELSNNKRPNGSPIANPWTSPARKIIDTNRYIAANIFSMYRGLIDEPENTKREALAKLRKAGDNPFNQLLRPIAFLYTRQAENKRIATRAQRVLVDFNRDLVDRPPRTKKELETMYKNLNKVLDGLEKEAIDFETKKIVLQSRAKSVRDSLILKFFYDKKGELPGEQIKQIRKAANK